ncbi:MAG: hypothetical protein WCS48_02610 [Candidatus Izemoplasmatales bacterium]
MKISDFKQVIQNNVHLPTPQNEAFINDAKQAFIFDSSHSTKVNNFSWSRMILTFASTIFLFFLTTTLLMGTLTKATITLDINPSVAIKMNYFHRVIAIEALNPEALDLIEGVSTGNKTAEEIIEELYFKAIDLNYISATSDNLILLGISADSYAVEQEFEMTISTHLTWAESYFMNCHSNDTASSIYSGLVLKSSSSLADFFDSSAITTAVPIEEFPNGVISGTQSDSFENNDDYRTELLYTNLSETDFLAMAEQYQVSTTKLQMAIAVFNGYGNYNLVADLSLLLALPVAQLLALYQGIPE